MKSTKKTSNFLKKVIRICNLSLKKVTSYKAVKGRLNYRLYSDDLLKGYIK
jgi:hypothetical protein